MEKFINDFYVEPEKIKDKSFKDSLEGKEEAEEELVTLQTKSSNHRGNARNQYNYGVKREVETRSSRNLKMIEISRLSLLTEIFYSVVFVILPFSNKKYKKPYRFLFIYSCTHFYHALSSSQISIRHQIYLLALEKYS